MPAVNSDSRTLSTISHDMILKSLSEGVCVIDAARRVVFVNDAAAKMLRSVPEELRGRKCDFVFFGVESVGEEQLAVCPIQFALHYGASSHIKSDNFVRRDGELLPVEYMCTAVADGSEVVGAVVTFQDISERRDIEAAVAAARDAALEAARAKTAFLANMSHEIRTPLGGVVGAASLLLESGLDGEQRALMETLQRSIDALLETVNDVLDFSKIEAGKMTLETIVFDLRGLLDDTYGIFRASAVKKELGIRLIVADDVPRFVRGDASRLRQVLNNLLSNAVKFTAKGEVRIYVETDGPRVRFEVADTGIGIASAEQTKLFQPFTQADVTMTRRFGGTGLGLAISREIVEIMGGEIGVRSEAGKGSKFWFRIPLETVETEPPPDRREISETPDRARLVEDGALSVLVAEDDEVNREITVKLLSQIGVAAVAVANGVEAVREATAAGDFDLILMDCQMPELDGFAATEMILGADLPKRPKIVALTAYNLAEEAVKFASAGMDDQLGKPVTKGQLVSLLRRHFGEWRDLPNLDLPVELIQHSLSGIVTPEILSNFLAIEARGEKGFVAEIMRIFCTNAEKFIADIGDDAARRDDASLRRRAHSLKGSSANVGLEELTVLFGSLQEAAAAADWLRVEKLLPSIAERFEHTKRKLMEL